ncbi:hypothetical protein OAB57_03535 [Bacteriovoracaceae bacterium]|nr:hypothetical protein [Bacteriovoracaceae bacterium]
MKTETTEEFLARGGKISKSSDNDISLGELLEKEGLVNDSKTVVDSLSDSITDSLNAGLKPQKV